MVGSSVPTLARSAHDRRRNCSQVRKHECVVNEDEENVEGFRIAPRFRSVTVGPLPAKIELNIVRELPSPFGGLIEDLGRSVSARIGLALKPVAANWSGSFTRAFSLHLDRIISPEIFQRLREAVPSNWVRVEDSDWDIALETMNQGIPLIWVPGPATVGLLLKAGGADKRLVVLEERKQAIVGDCLTVLKAVTSPDLLPLAGLAEQAAFALRDGHCAASQALSANVFDTWLRGVVRRGVLFILPAGTHFGYRRVLRQMQPVDGSVPLAELKASGALTPVIMALAEFDPDGGVSPTSFGRHATAHAAALGSTPPLMLSSR
jgi:hypothetical protein